jgi:hypothetical protein
VSSTTSKGGNDHDGMGLALGAVALAAALAGGYFARRHLRRGRSSPA